MDNPAYVKWVEMVKDGEEKLVHPGNVKAHEDAGWALKVLADQPVAVETPASVPEKKTRAPGRKVKAGTKASTKKVVPEAKPSAPVEGEDQPAEEK